MRWLICGVIILQTTDTGLYMNMFGFLQQKKQQEAVFSYTPNYVPVSVENALKDSVVFGCIRIISELISQVKFSSADQTVDSLLSKPNYMNTQGELFRIIVQNMLSYGEAFIEIKRSSNNAPVLLMVIDNDSMVTGINKVNTPTYNYQARNTNVKRRIKYNDMIHIRDIPSTSVDGISRIEQNLGKIQLLIDSDNLAKTTFRNGIDLKYNVTIDGVIDEAKTKKITESLKAAFNSNEGGEKVFVSSSKTSIEELKGSTPADNDLRSFRKNLIDEVCGIFGVPSFMLGGNSDQKYSNVRQKSTALFRDTILPLLINITEKMSSAFESEVNSDITNLIKGDSESQMRLATQGLAGGLITVNEARQMLDFEILEGEVYNTVQKPKPFDSDDMQGSGDEPNAMNPEANR